jgi:hypothetical protein
MAPGATGYLIGQSRNRVKKRLRSLSKMPQSFVVEKNIVLTYFVIVTIE